MAESYDVIIVGAGLTGISAARQLRKSGINSIILEATSSVGGRLRTHQVSGCLLDEGFQVLLPAYPSIRNDSLKHEFFRFSRSATCYGPEGRKIFADPLHEPKEFLTEKSPATKLDLLKLLRGIALGSSDLTTIRAIEKLGFSDQFTSAFLKPFLSGVLLDPDLVSPWNVSSYFMTRFFLGGAALVKGGVQSFAEVLAKDLTIRLESQVESVCDRECRDMSGQSYAAKVIIDTRPESISNVHWLSTQCHYFLVPKELIFEKRLILVDSRAQSSINHVANLSEVCPSYSPSGTSLLSVTTRKVETDSNVILHDLEKVIDTSLPRAEFLKSFTIEQALPHVRRTSNIFPRVEDPILIDGVIQASDAVAYGSQYAAMQIGEQAANVALKAIQN